MFLYYNNTAVKKHDRRLLAIMLGIKVKMHRHVDTLSRPRFVVSR